MRLEELKEAAKMQFWIEPGGNDKIGYDVMSVEGGLHDHYDTLDAAEKARDELNRKYRK